MRRAPVAAILALAIAPAAHAAEAKVTVTGGGAGAPIPASTIFAEPAAKLVPVLTDATATAVVRVGATERLRLRVAMPNAARLAPGTYATGAGASIVLLPNTCGGAPLTGSFTLAHAIPGVRHTAPTELYLTATVHCGAAPAATTVAVRLARPRSRASANEAARSQQPVIDGLSTGWSDAKGRAFFASGAGSRAAF